MEFKRWRNYCLHSLGGAYPKDAQPCSLFAPLIFLVDRPPEHSRGFFAISCVDELFEPEDVSVLQPAKKTEQQNELREFVAQNGASVLNTAFAHAFDFLNAPKKQTDLKLTLVGLGDVGGTLLTALKLLGNNIAQIGIYDPNEAQCRRYEQELNQVLGKNLPRIAICEKAQLFDCDVFLFTASLGVPAVGATVKDVRMAQFEKNREMLKGYAKMAREASFGGLFCQISDPVDQLARVVFLHSNRDENGVFDAKGLLPEQVQGFGLGVMAARAAYYAEKEQLDFSNGRAYGPHGADLIIANHPTQYDETLSSRLTELTVSANLKVRELGFKPYIAPALSSAAISILQLLRGEAHYGAIPLGGAYFGCRSRFTPFGVYVEREVLNDRLAAKLDTVHRKLEAFPYD